MPELAKEGVDARNIGRLTARLARANAALEAVADRAEQALVQRDGKRQTLDIDAFLSLPNEIRLRLLQRAIDRVGHEGPAELGKVETLLDELIDALSHKALRSFRRTLAGALVEVGARDAHHRACATAPHRANTLLTALNRMAEYRYSA